jgi:hypothetical protein
VAEALVRIPLLPVERPNGGSFPAGDPLLIEGKFLASRQAGAAAPGLGAAPIAPSSPRTGYRDKTVDTVLGPVGPGDLPPGLVSLRWVWTWAERGQAPDAVTSGRELAGMSRPSGRLGGMCSVPGSSATDVNAGQESWGYGLSHYVRLPNGIAYRF